jgi:hypothetical protein
MTPSTPLNQAIKVKYASSSGNEKMYQGIVNRDWSIGNVPNGGEFLVLSPIIVVMTSAALGKQVSLWASY